MSAVSCRIVAIRVGIPLLHQSAHGNISKYIAVSFGAEFSCLYAIFGDYPGLVTSQVRDNRPFFPSDSRVTGENIIQTESTNLYIMGA